MKIMTEEEKVEMDRQIRATAAVCILLKDAACEDVLREGLTDTPKRYVNFLKEFTNPPEYNFTTFDAEGNDEMVLVSGIPFYSLCEHHMVPFFGVAHIGYIPNGKIVGLSKIPRLLDKHARALQNQERIAKGVADELVELLSPDVAVIIVARHLCMEMRGVRKPGAETATSAMRGVFKNDFNARQEFLSLIKTK